MWLLANLKKWFAWKEMIKTTILLRTNNQYYTQTCQTVNLQLDSLHPNRRLAINAQLGILLQNFQKPQKYSERQIWRVYSQLCRGCWPAHTNVTTPVEESSFWRKLCCNQFANSWEYTFFLNVILAYIFKVSSCDAINTSPTYIILLKFLVKIGRTIAES